MENLGCSYKLHHSSEGVSERFVLSAKTEMQNRVVVFDEDHLRRLMNEYIDYYNRDRCHLSLDRDAPLGRKINSRPASSDRASHEIQKAFILLFSYVEGVLLQVKVTAFLLSSAFHLPKEIHLYFRQDI